MNVELWSVALTALALVYAVSPILAAYSPPRASQHRERELVRRTQLGLDICHAIIEADNPAAVARGYEVALRVRHFGGHVPPVGV